MQTSVPHSTVPIFYPARSALAFFQGGHSCEVWEEPECDRRNPSPWVLHYPATNAASAALSYSCLEAPRFWGGGSPTRALDRPASNAHLRHSPSIQCAHHKPARDLRAPWWGSPSDPLRPY